MHSIDSFGARVCTVEIHLEPESAQQRFVWSRDSFRARVCTAEICLEPDSAQ